MNPTDPPTASSSDAERRDLTFRLLEDGDLKLMHRWLNDPAVVEWWEGDDVSWPAVVSDYGEGHGDPVEHWLALLDGGR